MSKKITIYKYDPSPFVRGIYKLVKKHNLDVEFVNMSLFEGEQLTDEYKSISPNQTVPCLVDGDITINQSNTILRYLCLKYDLPEYNQDMHQRIAIDEMLDFFISEYWPFVNLLSNLVGISPLVTFNSNSINQEMKEKTEERKTRKMNIIEKKLSNNKYLCGDTETIADYNAIGIINLGFLNKDFSLDDFPNIKQWLGNFQEDVDLYRPELVTLSKAFENMRLQLTK